MSTRERKKLVQELEVLRRRRDHMHLAKSVREREDERIAQIIADLRADHEGAK